jgi:hypothetical protein
MGTSLFNTTPANTYPALIKVGDNTSIDGTLKVLSDGAGNDLPLWVSTTSLTNYGGGNVLTNTAFGSFALFSNTTGTSNTAFGFSALYFNLTANQNTAFGTNAATYNTTGEGNTAMGWQSLIWNETGSGNVAIGNRANYGTTGQSCSNNVAIGNLALLFNYGNNNVAIGYQSLRNNTTATNNTAVGTNTASGNFSGSVILGNQATATANNQFVVGSSTTNAGAVNSNGFLIGANSAWNVKVNGTDYNIPVAGTSSLAKLQIQGSGSTSATTALLVQNSAGSASLTVRDDREVLCGAGLTVGNAIFADRAISQGGGSGLINTTSFNSQQSYPRFGLTSDASVFYYQASYNPTSGSGAFAVFNATPTINQTGGANGITRGLYINPTLTSAADFRAIEVSNGGAYINTTSVQASAILQADSTTKGFLPPRMTTAQRVAISSPANGLIVFDTDVQNLCYRRDSTWVQVSFTAV